MFVYAGVSVIGRIEGFFRENESWYSKKLPVRLGRSLKQVRALICLHDAAHLATRPWWAA